MALIITDSGKEQALSYLIGRDTSVEGLKIKLFGNNFNPDSSVTSASFTEIFGGGYSEKDLTASSWVLSGGTAVYPEQTWTFTSSIGNVYGYYIVTSNTGVVVFAEKFSGGPYNVTTNGDKINVNISISII